MTTSQDKIMKRVYRVLDYDLTTNIEDAKDVAQVLDGFDEADIKYLRENDYIIYYEKHFSGGVVIRTDLTGSPIGLDYVLKVLEVDPEVERKKRVAKPKPMTEEQRKQLAKGLKQLKKEYGGNDKVDKLVTDAIRAFDDQADEQDPSFFKRFALDMKMVGINVGKFFEENGIPHLFGV